MPRDQHRTTMTSPERSSLLAGQQNIKWVEQPVLPSRHAASRRRSLFIMLFASFIFLAGLVFVLAAPQRKRQVSGPVIGSNFQDPSVLQLADGSWYAYAGVNGNPAGINVLVATSSDFSSWAVHSGWDALPTLPAWAASPPHVWAPDITQLVGSVLDPVLLAHEKARRHID